MDSSQRISALIAYIPVIGWIYVFFFQHKSPFAVFHLRQSLGLVLTLLAVFVAWVVSAWIMTWIPFLDVIAVALFTLVIAAVLVLGVSWLFGIANALRGRMVELPLIGGFSKRLPL